MDPARALSAISSRGVRALTCCDYDIYCLHRSSVTMALRYCCLALGAFAMIGSPSSSISQQNPQGLAAPRTAHVRDRFVPCKPSEVKMTGGFLGTRVAANAKNRMLTIDEDELLD